jgi:hypothetical protein
MKVEQAIAPSLEEFKSTCHAEFAFLVETHGFREVPDPPAPFPNPFEVHFEKSGWRIIVEGQSYGFGADVVIRGSDQRSFGCISLGCLGFSQQEQFSALR